MRSVPRRCLFLALPLAAAALLFPLVSEGQKPPTRPGAFVLAPAVALEAEDFTVEKGWAVVKNGQGNYMVDIIGFNHISGERLLGLDEKDEAASAYRDIVVPESGAYRLWVRYEYPAFCETRFRVVVEQGGRAVLDAVMLLQRDGHEAVAVGDGSHLDRGRVHL